MIQVQAMKDFFLGNGLATEFPLSFPVPEPQDGNNFLGLIVSDVDGSNPETITTGYTLERADDAVTVVYPATGTPLPTGKKLTVYRQVPLTQPTDLENGGNFYAETIESTFDWLEMQIQQVSELASRAVAVDIESGESQSELLASIYAARDTAVTNANSATVSASAASTSEANAAISETNALQYSDDSEDWANKAKQWAENPEDTPVDPGHYSAYHWAKKAEEATGGGGTVTSVNNIEPDADKNVQVTYYTTLADFQAQETAGTLVPGARYVRVDGDTSTTPPGADQVDIATDGTQHVIAGGGAGQGMPLLTPIPVMSSLIMPGFLSVCMDNGILTKASFPDAYAELVMRQGLGDTNIRTMGDYTAVLAAQGGIAPFFALDTAGETFRIPCAPGAFWRGASASNAVGGYGIDTMRPVVGEVSRDAQGGFMLSGGFTSGAFTRGAATTTRASDGTTGSAYRIKLDTALLGSNYSGTETAPLHVVTDYQMKMYGTVTEASSANIAALISATAGKLDTSIYDADEWGRLNFMVRFDGTTGAIRRSINVNSVTRTAVGVYTVSVLPLVAGRSYSVWGATAFVAGTVAISIDSVAGEMDIVHRNGSNANADGTDVRVFGVVLSDS